MKPNITLTASLAGMMLICLTACDKKSSQQNLPATNKPANTSIQSPDPNNANSATHMAQPRIVLDTNSYEFLKVIKYSLPTFSSKPISSNEEEFLSWFSNSWKEQVERIKNEVASIQDIQMRSSLQNTKLAALKSSDLTQYINEATKAWLIYKNRIISEHTNDFAEVAPYSGYSPQDETVNYKFKVPIKDMDLIFYKIKTKHADEIGQIIQRRTEGRVMELAIYNQEFAPGGREHFQERIWPEVENEVRQRTLVFAYSANTKDLYLLDRDDSEVYFKWNNISIPPEDTIVGKLLFEQNKKNKESKAPQPETSNRSEDEE